MTTTDERMRTEGERPATKGCAAMRRRELSISVSPATAVAVIHAKSRSVPGSVWTSNTKSIGLPNTTLPRASPNDKAAAPQAKAPTPRPNNVLLNFTFISDIWH